MKIPLAQFNLYLLLALAILATGCQSPEERKQSKEASTLRLFLEVNKESGDRGGGVPIYRQSPIRVSVEREPFLSEADLESAAVIEEMGAYAIQAQFNGHGALVLEGVTASRKGRRIAIQSTFGETRWLGAPLITRRIANGQLTFTPDATRDEADRVVRGLTNVIAKIKKKSSGF